MRTITTVYGPHVEECYALILKVYNSMFALLQMLPSKFA